MKTWKCRTPNVDETSIESIPRSTWISMNRFLYPKWFQIKCCKSTCEVMDATELLMCSSCLDRAFTSHYSMINATWWGIFHSYKPVHITLQLLQLLLSEDVRNWKNSFFLFYFWILGTKALCCLCFKACFMRTVCYTAE